MKLTEATTAYHTARKSRRDAVRENASRRMRKLPQIPVPLMPVKPNKLVAYETDGTFGGVVYSGDISEVPEGMTYRWEPIG